MIATAADLTIALALAGWVLLLLSRRRPERNPGASHQRLMRELDRHHE